MIVAIGGGEISQGETWEIDEKIASLAKERSGRKTADLLFIPTASYDEPGYVDVVRDVYGELGISVEALFLHGDPPPYEAIREAVLTSDAVYVGGGSTETMMSIWKATGTDRILLEAHTEGIVMAGLSAGSICWFLAGHSDSEFVDSDFDETIVSPQYKWVKGLGLLPYLHCPHYDEEYRSSFDEWMGEQSLPAIALENRTAVVCSGCSLKVIRSDRSKQAYLLENRGGRLFKRAFEYIEY
jgi:dipeptidase E